MMRQNNNAPFSQRQLRVGELIKQSLGQIFLKEEAKVPTIMTRNITVTEVRMIGHTLYLWEVKTLIKLLMF